MTLKIRRAAVLGAGVMGAQIAAHLASAGIRTYLLDLPANEPPKDPKQALLVGKNIRSQRAILAVEHLKQLKPSPLVSLSVLPNIIPGNFEDDWSVLAEADWIIEAVVERLDIKKDIHKRISEVARPHVPVSTNTSGIPLKDICKDLPEHYQQAFLGTHFFNPPRYMKLVEVIGHERSDELLLKKLSMWISERLGKGVVDASDTINFIANRIGALSIQARYKHMEDLGLNVSTVDALTGPLIGHPKSGTFRLLDIIGLDTFAHVTNNVYNLIKNDPFHSYFATPAFSKALIDQGAVGQKSPKGGFYQKSKNASGETVFLVLDIKQGKHVEEEADDIPWAEEAKRHKDLYSRLNFIFSKSDKYAEFLWRIHRDVFSYSALLLEEIAHGEPRSLDNAMSWGFNWDAGPFQVWQGCGYEQILARMKKDDAKLPSWVKEGVAFYEPAPQSKEWSLAGPTVQLVAPNLAKKAIARKPHEFFLPKAQNGEDKRVVISNKSASLVDIGDGIACLTFHSKMNTLNDEIIEFIQKAVAAVSERFDGLVIANEGDNFSAGANLASVLDSIEKKDFAAIDRMIRSFQGAVSLIKFAPFPSVSAPHALTLGGGCEVSLHASQVILANDTFAGLVEVGVGLIPAGGGTKELALRAYDAVSVSEGGDPMAFLRRAFMLIGMGRVSTSGLEAVEMGLYPRHTKVSISRDHQILRAKLLVLEQLKFGYAAPLPRTDIVVVGDPGIQTFKLALYNMVEGRQASAYDALIGEQVATVLCGGAVDGGSRVSEQYFLDLERNAFVFLCQQEKTKERIAYMLKTGKPLRN